MTESEWLELKRYLDEHGIEYRTKTTFIAGPISSFIVLLPLVTCVYNAPDEFVTGYPEVASAMEELRNTSKGIEKK